MKPFRSLAPSLALGRSGRLLARWATSIAALSLLALPLAAGAPSAHAEGYESVQASTVQPFTPAQLEELVAPIALYPDVVLDPLLPATTTPLDVIAAARHLQAQGGQVAVAPSDVDWSPAVTALLQYPDVLGWMSDNLPWLESVGYAMSVQPQDVLNAVQRYRWRAREAGVLVDNAYQRVYVQRTPSDFVYVVIEPVRPQIVYVPVYEPWPILYGNTTWTAARWSPYRTWWGYSFGSASPWSATQIAWSDLGVYQYSQPVWYGGSRQYLTSSAYATASDRRYYPAYGSVDGYTPNYYPARAVDRWRPTSTRSHVGIRRPATSTTTAGSATTTAVIRPSFPAEIMTRADLRTGIRADVRQPRLRQIVVDPSRLRLQGSAEGSARGSVTAPQITVPQIAVPQVTAPRITPPRSRFTVPFTVPRAVNPRVRTDLDARTLQSPVIVPRTRVTIPRTKTIPQATPRTVIPRTVVPRTVVPRTNAPREPEYPRFFQREDFERGIRPLPPDHAQPPPARVQPPKRRVLPPPEVRPAPPRDQNLIPGERRKKKDKDKDKQKEKDKEDR